MAQYHNAAPAGVTPSHRPRGPAAGHWQFNGSAAWQAGDGALSWCAVDRAVEVDPDDPMAESVAQLLLGAVSPTTWDPPRGEDLPLFRG